MRSTGLLAALSVAAVTVATPVGHAVASAGAAGSLAELRSTLGVLRRPQVRADRPADLLKTLRKASTDHTSLGLFGRPQVRLARLTTTAPWGQKIFLVPMLPPTKSAVAGLPRALRDAARNTTAGFELYPAPLGRSAPYETVAEIEAGIAFDSDGPSRYAMVFPDGVAKVQIWSQSSPQTGPVTAPVSHNVAAFSSSIQSWEPGREIWYGPRGDVIRRISDAASCKHTLNDCH